jgi:hypothetical protein
MPAPVREPKQSDAMVPHSPSTRAAIDRVEQIVMMDPASHPPVHSG